MKIYFKHYKNFEEAKYKWIERVQRIDWNNMFIMFTNWDGDIQLALRFDALPFKNKVIFVDEEITELKNAFVIDKWKRHIQLHHSCNFCGIRWIDKFDYVSFLNEGKI